MPGKSVKTNNAGAASNQATAASTTNNSRSTRPGPRDVWVAAEIAMMLRMRDEERASWDDIHKALGKHTRRSVSDKYWRLKKKERLAAEAKEKNGGD